jgi:phytoene dehydrogenase-like protein
LRRIFASQVSSTGCLSRCKEETLISSASEFLDGRKFDVVVIGAGMAGMAAAIRLALFDYKVLLLERHNVPGGLNSYYALGGRRYDVGLHAVTNYVPPGVRGTPLTKIFRQLRIDRDEFALSEQMGSRIVFPGFDLSFNNDAEIFRSEIARVFPHCVAGFDRLLKSMDEFDSLALDAPDLSARKILREHLGEPPLEDALLLPLCYYGSARENDMEFAQFVIMYNALFREGFARPLDGVRRVIRVLRKKYRALGGERRLKLGVKRIVAAEGKASRLQLDDGQVIQADHVVSTIGLVETQRLCSDQAPDVSEQEVGRLSFVETITVTDRQPVDFGWKDTIVFFNDAEQFHYQRPANLVDPRSGVICFPNNYRYPDEQNLDDGFFRVTALADFKGWTSLDEALYKQKKAEWFDHLREVSLRMLPKTDETLFNRHVIETDMFTPRTIQHFTGKLGGAVYGAPEKRRDGSTHLNNLYLCGTDQGFLGIIGAMLSGISIVNQKILAPS